MKRSFSELAIVLRPRTPATPTYQSSLGVVTCDVDVGDACTDRVNAAAMPD